MSLAEDAVLERINSVLEPSRMLTLAEKVTESAGSIDGVNLEVVAHEDFRIFATMNPGGDYGKRELSPALRSRFTEIWVPPVVDRTDIDLVLERSLRCAFDGCKSHDEGLLREFMLEYVGWFNTYLHSAFGSPKIELVLSLRDVITWSTFIKKMRQDAVDIGLFESYLHGASLMHLDGLGLGTGLSREEAKEMKRSAGQYLSNQIASIGKDEYSEVRSIDLMKFVHSDLDKYGIHPFYITAGPYQIPSSLNFNLNAPTTRVNMLRVFRAMQLSKPILLEGSPGTGKTR
jgi:midasin